MEELREQMKRQAEKDAIEISRLRAENSMTG